MEGRTVACLLLGMQLQMSPPAATFWCLSMGRGQMHVCHLARNCKCRPECNCMSSTRMQLCDIFVLERAIACLLLGMQLQMSPSTATLWCLSMGREHLHVCHLARNCKSRPRVQLHVFNATATLWCFVGERTIACLLLGMQQLISLPAATFWCLLIWGWQLHACHLAHNYEQCRPRVQLHVFYETTTLWCFVGQQIVACSLLCIQLEMSP